MDVRMDGRVALITGSSRGLGYAMALKFAQSGADVAICGRRPEVLEAARAAIAAESGGKVAAFVSDVSQADQVKTLYSSTVAELGGIDILVNNAGSSKTGNFEEITDEEFQFDLDLKLFAAIRLARLVLPGMRERKWGRIINILNVGSRTPSPRGAPTHISRAAGYALTKVLAGHGAPDNVLVNALMTGSIVTDQVVGQHERAKSNLSLADFIVEQGRRIPVGRLGTAEEYANVACFLASDAAAYVTGTAINIDGGSSPLM
jgi:NAD(P)-dependent dehydrogenase (short-subunit alcohol dehydrogenase family)